MRKSVLSVLVLGLAASTHAAVVTLNAGDGFGASSFNAAGGWSNAAAPSAGNAYVAGYVGGADRLLRTPADGNSYSFAGDSLTIAGTGIAAAANNQALMWKGTGTTSVITVNNLILDGGQLRHGQGDADSFTLAGNITVTANGGNMATQGGMNVAAAITGSGPLAILDNGNGSAARLVTFSNTGNTFTGNLLLNHTRSRFALADDANLNFVIGANGVNNSVSGVGVATFNGDFLIDLAGADATNGNAWALVSLNNPTYGSTFNVAGFTPDAGGTLWTLNQGAATYTFDEASGRLSVVVPEPTTLAAFAGLGLLAARRRK